MKKLFAVSLLSFALAVPALADDDDYVGPLNVPRGEWLSASQAIQKIEAQGYKVHEIEADDGYYEFEGTNSSGVRVDGHAHPATGEVLSTHPDRD
ncbi:PepSY domain-containing protein [Hyphomicrobium sp.]|uniref:PepSY domain-containing protein n=1 Tax=Hyphomicrobium sp. TaxID=82 RepID=UPI0025C6310B|nr:PepSY domain-containing protein [Hyphomicrobium sp.]MCC7253890.1 PepSY domain-containing protein [Hyphomicrobium sp.]